MTGRDPGLTRFVREQHPRLVGSLGLYTGDADLAEELAAEALARVARDWSSIRQMDASGAYAHRIAMNLANSWFRRRRALRRAMARRGPDPDVHHDADAGTGVAVRTAVAALPPRQRACVVLHYFAGMTTAEAAVALEVAPGTVRSNLHAARSTLRDLLGGDVELPVADVAAAPSTSTERGAS